MSATSAVAAIETFKDSQRAETASGLIPSPVYRSARSGAAALLDPRQRPIHEEHERKEDERQRDRDVEIALAGLEHGGRREHPGRALDVAADHEGGAHFGNHRAEPGHDGRQHGQARFLQQGPDHLRARGAQGQELKTELRGNLLDGGQREADHDGRGDHELRQDHRRGRVEELEEAECSAPPQHDRHEEADNDGRQPHAGVDEADREAAAREAGERQQRAERNADGEGNERRRRRDGEGQPCDTPHFGVSGEQEPERLGRALDEELHGYWKSAAVLSAMGTKSGWPNLSTPKVLITACVSGATMKSAKALPPATLTRGPLAGLISMTE